MSEPSRETKEFQQDACIKKHCMCLQYPLYLRCYFDHSLEDIKKLTEDELSSYNDIMLDNSLNFETQ